MVNQFIIEKISTKKNLSQWIVAFEVFLISTALGQIDGWSTSALPKLLSPKFPTTVTKQEASWILSATDIGMTVGSIIPAVITSKLGTKTSLLITGVIELIGFAIQALTNSVNLLFIARLIAGCSLGMSNVIQLLYIGEISNPKIRGAICGVHVIGMDIGEILGNVLGERLDFHEFACAIIVLIVIFLSSFFWLPKSPYHLIMKNEDEKAMKSLEFYRPDVDATSEILSLKKFIKTKQTFSYCDAIFQLFTPQNRSGLIILIILVLCTQLSGAIPVIYHTGIILEKMENKTIIIPLITASGLIGSILSTLTNDKFGRKVLFFVSSCIIAIALATLSIYYILLDNKLLDETILNYIVIGALLLRKIFMSYGILSIIGTLESEFFAPNVKILSVSITNIVSGLLASIAVLIYEPLLDTIGYNIYFFYAFFMIFVCFFVHIFIPETKNKSLSEIQDMLNIKSKK